MSVPNASEQATTLISNWGADSQFDRARDAVAALFGRYAEIRQRVEELKKHFLTAAEITELADITSELVELVDLNETLREIAERIRVANKPNEMLPIHCRMARKALGWGVLSLASEAGVSPDIVARFERGEALDEKTVEAIQNALQAGGVEFTNSDRPGVSVRKVDQRRGGKYEKSEPYSDRPPIGGPFAMLV
jgi:hypothetical protein